MSRKNTDPKEIAARKVHKALRNTPPGYIDLIEFVKIRTHCTTGMAKTVLLAGVLRVDSHPVGYRWISGRKELDPYLPAKHRGQIVAQWSGEPS